ncbi:MAG: MCE family protein [Gemmataceae bacterium]|nr:MCE family protein [Gemmataceae bacterium]
MNEQAIRFRFGIFVLASLILLAVLTILFGGFPNYFRRTESFTIVFNNAQGVSPGTPVRRSGVRIGEVRSVKLNNNTGKVTIEIGIGDQYFLRKGDRATLTQSLLGGEATVVFIPPDDPKLVDTTRVEPGAEFQGINPADPGSLVQKAADLAVPLEEALIEIRKTFQAINKLGPVAENTLKDFGEVGKMARNLGPDLQKTSEEIRLLAKSTRDIIPDLKKTNDEIQLTARYWGKVGERADVLLRTNEDKIAKSIDRMEEALKRINNLLGDENQKYVRDALKDTSELIRESRITVKQVNESLKRADEAIADLQKALKPLGDRGPSILKNVDESAESLNRTMKDVRELMQIFARSEGTVQKLLGDPSIYNNLNDSALMATKILPRLDRILRDVEIFADKLARHPELIGIGGALRPSSGLKESPFPYRTYP